MMIYTFLLLCSLTLSFYCSKNIVFPTMQTILIDSNNSLAVMKLLRNSETAISHTNSKFSYIPGHLKIKMLQYNYLD